MPTGQRSKVLTARRWGSLVGIFGLLGLLLAQMGASAAHAVAPQQVGAPNTRPAFVRGEILATTYDGDTDDLLTAGLGQAGLQLPLPAFADPASPTRAELRRSAIYNNYRAIVDVTPGSGYGTLYGPAVGPGATPSGKIAGKEYLAYADDGTGQQNVTMMVQIPAGFDPAKACIVTAPSSGSRGVYGAIGGVGEWALKKGCAVAYTDKGSGLGVHDLTRGTVNRLTGERATLADAGINANFVATFNPLWATANPNRYAIKHAHSQQNPEVSWGTHVLQAIEFAFYVLNLPENYGTPGEGGASLRALVPTNTLVIGAGVSNGGGATLQAAEIDTAGLIDGVAVSEPNVNPEPVEQVIKAGPQRWSLPNHSRSLIDYYTFLNLYAPCALRAPEVADAPQITAPLTPALGDARCAGLAALGLVTGDTPAAQASDALGRVRAYGMVDEQLILLASHHNLVVFESIAMLYTNAYGRFSVSDNVCGFSYTFTDGTGAPIEPTATNLAQLAGIFGTGNGIPPTSGLQIVDERSVGGPRLSRLSVSPGGALDQNLDGALCLRRLATGVDEQGRPLQGGEAIQSSRVRQGAAEVRASGDLGGKPTIIVHGRADSVIPVNYAARAYFGLNRQVEAEASQLRYYEILNAQHFDAFLGFPGYNTRFVPIHHYALVALDLIYAHLTSGAALPPSQIIATTPRAAGDAPGTAQPITAANLPGPSAAPELVRQIVYQPEGKLVRIGIDREKIYVPVAAR